jgi:hypothetical protein
MNPAGVSSRIARTSASAAKIIRRVIAVIGLVRIIKALGTAV